MENGEQCKQLKTISGRIGLNFYMGMKEMNIWFFVSKLIHSQINLIQIWNFLLFLFKTKVKIDSYKIFF